MSSYHEMQYCDLGGTYELLGAFFGGVGGLYYSQNVSGIFLGIINSAGLTTLIAKEPVIARIACAVGGILAGYFFGKLMGAMAIVFRRKADNKMIKKQLDERVEWVKQNPHSLRK